MVIGSNVAFLLSEWLAQPFVKEKCILAVHSGHAVAERFVFPGAGGSLAGRATNSNFIPDPFSKMESSIGQEAKLKIPLSGRRILFSSVPFSNSLIIGL